MITFSILIVYVLQAAPRIIFHLDTDVAFSRLDIRFDSLMR
jgi:hypothetical protein